MALAAGPDCGAAVLMGPLAANGHHRMLSPAALGAPRRSSSADGSSSASTVLSPSPPPAAAAHAGSPLPAVAALQAAVQEGASRAAALELELAAKAEEASMLDAYQRRVQELEALYMLTTSELAREKEQHQAEAVATAAQMRAQQLRIAALEQQLAALQGPGGGCGASVTSSCAGDGAAGTGLTVVLERQASGQVVGDPLPVMSDFARDARLWSAPSVGAPGSDGAGRRALSSGTAAAGWGAATGAAALPLRSVASEPVGWDAATGAAAALLLGGGGGPHHSLLADVPPRHAVPDAGGGSAAAGRPPPHRQQQLPESRSDQFEALMGDRIDAQRLAGLLPFDLDTLGADRADGAGIAPPPIPPQLSLPPGGTRSHSAGASVLKPLNSVRVSGAPATAGGGSLRMHHSLPLDASGAPRLRSWSDTWGGSDASAAAVADTAAALDQQHSLGASSLKRLAKLGSGGLPAAAGPAASGLFVPVGLGPFGDAAAVDGIGSADDAAHQNSRLRSKGEATPNPCVYVGFLGWWVTERELEAAFSPFGALLSVRLLISKKSRRSREQAFVEFDSVNAARAAIAALDAADIPGLVKQQGCGGLVVRYADKKKEEDLM